MEVINAKSFTKALAKLRPREVDKVEEAVESFKENRADPALRDHPLKGKMKNLRAFSAAHDLRVICQEEGGFVAVILLDARTHNQVYREGSVALSISRTSP